MATSNCPKCSARVPPGAASCESCGLKLAGSKFLCENCHGAYAQKELAIDEGRLLCPICRSQKERRTGVAGEPGLARMAAWHMRKEPARTSRMAVASLLTAFLLPPIAPLLGIVSLVSIDASRGALRGKGLAMAGTVLGLFLLGAGVFIGLFVLRNQERIVSIAADATRNRAAATIAAISAAQKSQKDKTGAYAGIDELVKAGLLEPRVLDDPDYRYDVFLSYGRFTVTAVPRGNLRLYFLLDEKGDLRYEEDRPAVSPDSPLWRDRMPSSTPRPVPVRGG